MSALTGMVSSIPSLSSSTGNSLPLYLIHLTWFNVQMNQEVIRLEIEVEVKTLVAAGTPEFIARIKAASTVMSRRKEAPDRREAMATHCLES